MADNKKSFLMYADQIGAVKKLVINDRVNKTNNAGELFLHIMEYVNDTNPEAINFIVDLSFEPIKNGLKRDLTKYETYIDKQIENGKKGGRPKKEETQITQPFILKPKKADSVSDSDSTITTNEIIEIDVAIVECLKNQNWILEVERMYKIDRHKITFALNDFKSHCITTGENKPRSIKMFCKHFTNWVRIKKQYA